MRPPTLAEAKALMERGDRLVVMNGPDGSVAFRLLNDARPISPTTAKALLLGRWPKTNAPMTGRLAPAEPGPLLTEPGTEQVWKWQLRHDETPAARRKHRQAKLAQRRQAAAAP